MLTGGCYLLFKEYLPLSFFFFFCLQFCAENQIFNQFLSSVKLHLHNSQPFLPHISLQVSSYHTIIYLYNDWLIHEIIPSFTLLLYHYHHN